MELGEFWKRFNEELTPEQADCALAWLADHDGSAVLTAIAYAKGRYPG
ncbi:hypothetical protein GCM10009733_005670 [Nonomuraea maheshkhaliensis]|uniref:Uncharacterized protein n=1 Tax=Nonomuraea maheshkhaliensis TaxID=419590 RepID=A0ABN2EN42_9ACTN